MTAHRIKLFNVRCNELDVICQKPFESGCGYAAILNALHLGNNEPQRRIKKLTMVELINSYGLKTSKIFQMRLRHSDDGVKAEDLLHIYNEIRLELGLASVSGSYLNRQFYDLSQKSFLSRIFKLVRNSLLAGEPVVLLICSQIAKWSDERKEHLWESVAGHYVTAVGISDKINNDGSFVIEYIDPFDGGKYQMLVYSDVRNFAAFKGPKSYGRWVGNRPFPVLSGGAINLRTDEAPWYSRTLTYMQYAIFYEGLRNQTP